MTDPYRGPQNSSGFDLNQPTIISLLYLAGWVTGGVTGLVAGVLAFVWKDQPKADWERSHYAYGVITFIGGIAASVIGWILIFTLIGALIGGPLLLVASIWVTVRAVMSMLNAQKRLPMPNPQSWLF